MPTEPELGPWLGVVASPRPRLAPGAVPLDDVRIALVARLLEEGHKPAPDWQDAWLVAVDGAAGRVAEFVAARAARAAQASRAPERVAAAALPEPEDLGVLRTRLESAGIPLEEVTATIPPGEDPARHFSRLGGAVEESWLELERVVASVAAEWAAPAAAVERWRRPTAPLWVATGAILLLALLAGLTIGGQLPAPRWFAPVVTWWWSLPWP